MKQVRDHYFHKAKKEGFAARSAFKLKEIDSKHNLIRRGDHIIDLGCFPGSWMQYISQRVGNSGLVVGIDRTELKISLNANMRFLHADINQLDLTVLNEYKTHFDVVCSDMAPNTTGMKSVDASRSFQLCQMALLIAQHKLKQGGSTLVKILQGGTFNELLTQMRSEYGSVKIVKPKSSRSESKEIFVLGMKKK